MAGFAAGRWWRSEHTDVPAAANDYGPALSSGRLVARVDRLPSGGGVVLDQDKIVLTRGADGTVHGFSAVCTHQGCIVESVEDGAILCPCHGSRFDAQTGAVVSGPATENLPPVPVVVRAGGVYTT